jgi:hypothetical protein
MGSLIRPVASAAAGHLRAEVGSGYGYGARFDIVRVDHDTYERTRAHRAPRHARLAGTDRIPE